MVLVLKNVSFRRNTNSGIPEGVEVASVQAPEGSEAVVQLVAISTVDADGIAQFAGTGDVPILVDTGSVDGASEPGGSVTVGTTSSEIVAANPARRFLEFSNPDGPGDVWLRFGAGSASVGAGMWLPAGGNQPLPTGAIITTAVYAIATVAGTDVSVVEW